MVVAAAATGVVVGFAMFIYGAAWGARVKERTLDEYFHKINDTDVVVIQQIGASWVCGRVEKLEEVWEESGFRVRTERVRPEAK